MLSMRSLPPDYRAVVIGSTGGLGSAFMKLLEQDPACGAVSGFSRSSNPPVDLTNEASIARAAERIDGDVHLIINATGFLSDNEIKPEKALRSLEQSAMAKHFELNSTGPSIIMKHFTKKMPREKRGIFATLSARVGSIGDNALGGWYSYRASKAAQNMLMRCAAIEVARSRPEAVIVALHPGTVETMLSAPFSRNTGRLKPEQSAAMLLEVLDNLPADETGSFWDYRGERVEW